MPKTQNNAVMNWLFTFAIHRGVSRRLWGICPPHPLWTFDRGMESNQRHNSSHQSASLADRNLPSIRKHLNIKLINTGMTLEEYKFIFYMEWFHRFIARMAGLVYAIPVFYFLFKKTIPFKEFGIYFAMGMLFIAQAIAGLDHGRQRTD